MPRGKSRKCKKVGTGENCPPPGPNQCHPRVGAGSDGCFPKPVLEKAATNLGIPSQLTAIGGKRNITGTSSATKSLLTQIAEKVGVNPNHQRSLLSKLPLSQQEKEQLAQMYLRPPMPESWNRTDGNDETIGWLDSQNIRDVMKQYEEAFPKFKFYGPYPIDFAAPEDSSAKSKGSSKDCLVDEMCELDLDGKELEGKEHIGIVFNLDPHFKEGSHWMALYINIPQKRCYFFDSYGMRPPRQIYKFMQWLSIQEPNIQLGWNGRRFQRSEGECGMYCLYFLDRMIAGEAFLKFCRSMPSDKFMKDMRDWMYST
jgi:hypothetical protein